GALVNTSAAPAFTTNPGRAGLDVWRCVCLADGTHGQQRTGWAALVDPTTVTNHQLQAGQGFTVAPGDHPRLGISPERAVPTVTLCLFERTDPDAPDAVVLTSRPNAGGRRPGHDRRGGAGRAARGARHGHRMNAPRFAGSGRGVTSSAETTPGLV